MGKKAKPGYPRIKVDWKPKHLWNLDATLCGIIADGIRAFRKTCEASYPAEISSEQWKVILKKIERGYRIRFEEGSPWLPPKKEAKWQEAKALFDQYFEDLWD